jgi:hypothetical protein
MAQSWTPPPPPGNATANIPNYLVFAIVSILCCWPLAIPAIIFATQVNSKVAAGDIPGAQDASKKAKMFSFIAIGLGVLAIVVYVVILFLGIGLSAVGNH